MTLSQAVTLLETVESGAHWRAAYVVLSLLPGVRTEETRAITWDEVDLTAGMVAVYRSVRGQGRHQDPQEPPRAETAHPGDPGAPRAPRPPGRRAARGGGVVAGARPGVLPSGRNAAGPLARTEGVPEDHQGRPARRSLDAARAAAVVRVHQASLSWPEITGSMPRRLPDIPVTRTRAAGGCWRGDRSAERWLRGRGPAASPGRNRRAGPC